MELVQDVCCICGCVLRALLSHLSANIPKIGSANKRTKTRCSGRLTSPNEILVCALNNYERVHDVDPQCYSCWCFWYLDVPMSNLAKASVIELCAMDESMNMQPRDMCVHFL
jgi:hypothetical protein